MMIIQIPNSSAWQVDKIPDLCPYCHHKIIPKAYLGLLAPADVLNIFFICPNEECGQAFLAFYDFWSNSGHYLKLSIGNLLSKDFSKEINSISQKFIEIYNQAFFAEQNNLSEITGVGYRKSLEFLIKDYCVKNNPTDEVNILKMPIMQVINSYVNDERIKDISKRAVWLGNDETHYIRIWENKDLTILKTLIDLVIHWIEMEEMSKIIIEETPELSKKGNDKK